MWPVSLVSIRDWFFRRLIPNDTPIVLLGGRICIQWFGWDIKLPWGGYLCINYREHSAAKIRPCGAYLSRDATPPHSPPEPGERWLWRARRSEW
jgi:hypothetical protein